ncbi:hypothetical protein BMJ13_08070 [Staphylococcus saprophyticus]|uniref:hypothetical protein n=1 Tax=Staphylococcus saprophyticus TaxID=29385 RepID=UPI00094BAF50|nr:hypothetical protein [Staphylococcus saprophyticus]OLN92941.1 hypothetical protein BMJ13_08070 [Staphylococcus saprophyticus]
MTIKHTITYFKNHSDVANPLHYQLTFQELINTLSNVKTHADKGSAGVMVAGYATYRNNERTKTRSMITIDVDDIPNTIKFPSFIKDRFQFAYVIYPTHSHTENEQRYRLCIPLKEEIESKYYKQVTLFILKFLKMKSELEKDKYKDSKSVVFYDPASVSQCHAMNLPTTEDDGSNYQLHYSDNELLDPQPLVEHAKRIQEQEETMRKKGTHKRSKEDDEWINLLKGVGDGQRTHATEAMAGLFINKFSRDVAYELLSMWNMQNHPPLEEEKLLHHFNGIYKTHCNNNKLQYDPIK